MISSPTETKTEVVMPQMGVSVAEGTVTAWRRRPGDEIAADEPICDVTTDKIDVEVPSPASGVVARVLVEEGETVPVGTVLAEIERAASSEQRAAIAPEQGPGPEAPSSELQAPSSPELDRSAFISPVVRRIATEHHVDLSRVEGHGVGGRIRKADVLAFLANGDGGNGNGRPANGSRPLHTESPYRPEPAAPPTPAAVELAGPAERVPLTPMRQAIARHMLDSRRTSAHCTTIAEADFSAVASRRRELEAAAGARPTYLAFVARAVVRALERHPVLNASIDGTELVLHQDVNLGIAVALEEGLVVPVIRRAQRLSVAGLAEEIAALAKRARAGELTPDDTHGGTFTITNPGQFGAVMATPIINQPQVAILDLEAVVDRPVAIDDGAGGKAVAVRPMGYLCMSWDHRALDGAEAARFLAAVREGIEGGIE
jgi:2-oxoglutarate dehydrogenase E2 component (dihydrolipoamide succinyltransferase)